MKPFTGTYPAVTAQFHKDESLDLEATNLSAVAMRSSVMRLVLALLSFVSPTLHQGDGAKEGLLLMQNPRRS